MKEGERETKGKQGRGYGGGEGRKINERKGEGNEGEVGRKEKGH